MGRHVANEVRNRLRESTKLGLRRGLGKVGLDIGRDPFASRLTRALSARGIDTVLDIGANVGQYATLLRYAGYDGRIVSFEPLETAYEQLHGRAERDPHWTAINSGVGAESGSTTINVSANSYSSSVLPMTESHVAAAPDSVVVGTQTIQLTTVADIVVEHGVSPSTTLLKVDTQGYETQVLDGAGALLDAFAGVQLELSFTELYGGQELFDAMTTRLREHGFVLWSLEPGISGADGRLLQCDGLFLREAAASA